MSLRSCCRAHGWLPAALLIMLLPTLASAEHVLLWGVTRGCELDSGVSRSMKAQLEATGYTTSTVSGAVAGVSPQEAGAMLRAACPSVQGQLVGGVIEPEQPSTRTCARARVGPRGVGGGGLRCESMKGIVGARLQK